MDYADYTDVQDSIESKFIIAYADYLDLQENWLRWFARLH